MESFESIVDSDSLKLIIRIFPPTLRIPFLFVNRRWRENCMETKGGEGKNFQKKVCNNNAKRIEFDWFSHWACDRGHFDLLIWCRSLGCPWTEKGLTEKIASGGNLEMMKYAVAKGIRFTESENTIAYAAHRGNLEMVKWLREAGCGWSYVGVCQWSVSDSNYGTMSGNLDMLKWMYEKGCKFHDWNINLALKYRHFEIADWMIKAIKLDPNRLGDCHLHFLSKDKDNSEILEWLKRNNVELKELAYASFAEYGMIDALEYYFEKVEKNRSQYLNFTITNDAVKGQHIHVLEWLKSRGLIDFNGSTFWYGILSGNLEVLKWLRREGCAFGTWITCPSDDDSSLEFLKWLFDEEKYDLDQKQALLSTAAISGFIKSMNYLRNVKKIKWNRNVRFGDVESLKWAISNGYNMKKQTTKNAAQDSQYEVLVYAVENGAPWCPKKILRDLRKRSKRNQLENDCMIIEYVSNKSGISFFQGNPQ